MSSRAAPASSAGAPYVVKKMRAPSAAVAYVILSGEEEPESPAAGRLVCPPEWVALG